MADKNNEPTAERTEGRESDKNNSAPNQGSGEVSALKGGADGKAKGLGDKGVGDYAKTDQSERTYE